MKQKTWGEDYRKIVVCVDSYEHRQLCGRLFHPCLEAGVRFASLAEFLLGMETLMDSMEFPQAFEKLRTFSSVQVNHSGIVSEAVPANSKQRGEKATFFLRMVLRQNASWQGTILWAEGQQELAFRSVLELIHLMDSALNVKYDRVPNV